MTFECTNCHRTLRKNLLINYYLNMHNGMERSICKRCYNEISKKVRHYELIADRFHGKLMRLLYG